MRVSAIAESAETYILHHAYINCFQNAPAGKTIAHLNHKKALRAGLLRPFGFNCSSVKRLLFSVLYAAAQLKALALPRIRIARLLQRRGAPLPVSIPAPRQQNDFQLFC